MFTEPLERRRLLSVALLNGILRIRGGVGDDVITVSTDAGGGRIIVHDNASVRRYNTADVIFISIAGRAGNDTLSVADTITIPSEIYGETGIDRLNGGSGRDALITRNILPLWLPATAVVAVGLAVRRPRGIGAVVAAGLCAVAIAAHRNYRAPP